jgi:type I restriction enzyme S subunit
VSAIRELVATLCPEGVEYVELGAIADYSGTRVDAHLLNESTFVGVDNLLPNFAGRVDARREPNTPRLTAFCPGDLLLGNIRPYLKMAWLADREGGCSGDVLALRLNPAMGHVVEPKYLYYALARPAFVSYVMKHSRGAKMPRGDKLAILRFHLPVPPLPVQRAIIAILDKFTELEAELEAELDAELEARRRQYEHYRDQLLSFGKESDRDIQWMSLGDAVEYTNGKAHERLVDPEGDIPLVTARFISRNGEANRYVRSCDVATPALSGDIALVLSDLPRGRALARTFFIDRDNGYAINQRIARLRVRDSSKLIPRFLYYSLDRHPGLLAYDNGVDQTHLSKGQITGLLIAVPPVGEQERLVAILDSFNLLVTDLAIGLPAELVARRKQYEYYRDRLLDFDRVAA